MFNLQDKFKLLTIKLLNKDPKFYSKNYLKGVHEIKLLKYLREFNII